MTAHTAIDMVNALKRASYIWCDVYTGTKAQLLAAGFGAGRLFPGDPGGPKRCHTWPGVYGYHHLRVEAARTYSNAAPPTAGDRIFDVYASFVGESERPRARPRAFAPGVAVLHELTCDEYTGTAEALISAGLITESQLPGRPGCGRHTSTFNQDGNLMKASTHWSQPGNKIVTKYGKKIRVRFIVPETERAKRAEGNRQGEVAYERVCLDAKRARLNALSGPRERPALRLVWSA